MTCKTNISQYNNNLNDNLQDENIVIKPEVGVDEHLKGRFSFKKIVSNLQTTI